MLEVGRKSTRYFPIRSENHLPIEVRCAQHELYFRSPSLFAQSGNRCWCKSVRAVSGGSFHEDENYIGMIYPHNEADMTASDFVMGVKTELELEGCGTMLPLWMYYNYTQVDCRATIPDIYSHSNTHDDHYSDKWLMGFIFMDKVARNSVQVCEHYRSYASPRGAESKDGYVISTWRKAPAGYAAT